MAKYDFDAVVDRCGTDCLKYDCLSDFYGTQELFPMWIADMDFPVCNEISKALAERLAHPVYGYTKPRRSYWQSIINWVDTRHGLQLKREELAFVPGIVRGMAFAIQYFTRPGDKIVIQPPVYHPFRIVPEGTGRVVVENPLIERGHDAEGGFYEMDLEGLERIFAAEHPKMMILCNPHNPCGIQWDAETLTAVARLAKRHGVIVISDEIHGDLMLHGKRHVPFLQSCAEAADVSITFGAPSKTFNIAGLESSWMVVRNPELRRPFYQWMEVNEFSSPSFMAWIAAEAAYTHGAGWLDQALDYIERNVELLVRYCSENLPGIKAVRPEASFLVWLDCRGLGLKQPQLEELFCRKARLALNSGTMFGRQGEGFMRLNVGTPRAKLLMALEQLKQSL
ncbi:MAG: pyridoxal phosphate-dependent aminotransferase [Firmicutes bacterium]|nr:pyridoxal phosphate-dependent aminotransferase [Bacillota bacterium]MCM1400404.1 pyridoxal phosphate-dependent aminotransferase [Bacteroides sp.]MCM1477161.1 pyridoxal phosphate-dependent aminotransferase [Bacteroides sp.]